MQRLITVGQSELFKRGLSLGDTRNYCHLAVRPARGIIEEDQILIGATFLRKYYIFFATLQNTLTVGIGEADPASHILEMHYNPRTAVTRWLPEAKEADSSFYTGDWRDPY